jgi:ABC-2 type transport system ATP-binding protein
VLKPQPSWPATQWVHITLRACSGRAHHAERDGYIVAVILLDEPNLGTSPRRYRRHRDNQTSPFLVGSPPLLSHALPRHNTRMSLFELEQVTHFYGKLRALCEVSLSVQPGATGLVGQNGAGKSTMLKILLGLLRPTSGRGQVLGHDIRRSGIALRSRVGYMPEAEMMLPGLRGVQFVALAGELSGMPRRHALRRAHEVLSYLGLEEARYRHHEEYSVGMKQRLKLACALVHDPELLLLDEPTSGLDPEGRQAMLELLRTLATRHGKSLVLSTHLLGDIDRVCDSVIILDRGTVMSVGRIDELRNDSRGRYRLRWQGHASNFLADLAAEGVQVVQNGQSDEAIAVVPEGWSNRTFFALADNRQLVLREIEPVREELDEVYQRVVRSRAAPVELSPEGSRAH